MEERLYALVVEMNSDKNDEEVEVHNIDLADVLFMDYDPKERAVLYYHQHGKIYKTANKMMHFDTSKKMYDLGFYVTDRSNMVNMNYVEELDRKKGKVTFKVGGWLADVARINYNLVEFIIKEREKFLKSDIKE